MIIPGPIISALTFPGVVVHEFAHETFCKLFKVPYMKLFISDLETQQDM